MRELERQENKLKLLTRSEFRKLVAARLRDPKIANKDFIVLAKMYEDISDKRSRLNILRRNMTEPEQQTVDDLVLKLERENADG